MAKENIKFLFGIALYSLLSLPSFLFFLRLLVSNKNIPDGWIFLEPFIDNYFYFLAAIGASFIFRDNKLILLNIAFPILSFIFTNVENNSVPLIQVSLYLAYYVLTYKFLHQKFFLNQIENL